VLRVDHDDRTSAPTDITSWARADEARLEELTEKSIA